MSKALCTPSTTRNNMDCSSYYTIKNILLEILRRAMDHLTEFICRRVQD